MTSNTVNTNPSSIIDNYFCTVCKASKVKLWRYSCSSDVWLHCGQCALNNEKRTELKIDENGNIPIRKGEANWSPDSVTYTNFIGNFTPAVRDSNGLYWGACSNIIKCDWDAWIALPLIQIASTK